MKRSAFHKEICAGVQTPGLEQAGFEHIVLIEFKYAALY